MKDYKIKYYTKKTDKQGASAYLEDMFEDVETVESKTVADIRKRVEQGKDYDDLKDSLDGFTPSVYCVGGRDKEHIVEHTGILHFDLDKLDKDLLIVQAMQSSVPYIWRSFVSPSGRGLKVFVKTKANLKTHERYIELLTADLANDLDIDIKKIDPSCKDAVRLCYMSHSPVYRNNAAVVVDKEAQLKDVIARRNDDAIPANKAGIASPLLAMTEHEASERFAECVRWTNKYKTFVEGSRNNWTYFLAQNCKRKALSKEVTYQQIVRNNYCYDETEVTNCINSAYKDMTDFGKYAEAASLPEPVEYKIDYTDIELTNLQSENRFLVEDLMMNVGTSVLCGVPDGGKSQFIRMLCLYISLQKKSFLGRKLFTKYGRCLIVVSEDDETNISYLLKKQLTALNEEATGNLKFLFTGNLSQAETLIEMEAHLSRHPCDLIVVDSLGDFIDGDMNNNIVMRKTVGAFDYLAKKHKAHCCLIHHVTKNSYKLSPHQANILGGSGLGQKVRLALQLSNGDNNLKYFSILKGNYLPRQLKQQSRVLHFDEETFLFTDTGMTEATDAIGGSDKRESRQDRLQRLGDEIFDGKSLSYTEFTNKHQQINDTGKAQAQRDHKSMKELRIIIKDDSKWKMNDGSLLSES